MKLRKSQWMLFLLFLMLLGILLIVLPSCTHRIDIQRCPDPNRPVNLKQKLPEPFFPFTRKPFKA